MVLAQQQTMGRPDKQNGIELPTIKTHLQPPEFLYICQKHTLEERKPLQQTVLGRQISTYQRMKLDPCLSPCTKINSKGIRNQRKTQNFKITRGNYEQNISRSRHPRGFSEWLPIAQKIEPRTWQCRDIRQKVAVQRKYWVSEETTWRAGENLGYLYIRLMSSI